MKNLRQVLVIMCLLASTSVVFPQTTDVTKDPLYRTKGDHKRTYFFAEANEQSPYRVYVPTKWDGKKKLPLVVILHSGGLTQHAPFDREPENLKGNLFKEADQHGFIIVCPMGYKGNYGAAARPQPPAGRDVPPPIPQTPEEFKRNNELSEKDVLNVIQIVSKEYKTDDKRTYLMGNALGEIGTLHLVQKYPQMWKAIAPSGDPRDADGYPFANVKGLAGALFVQGELDKGNRTPDNIARQKVFADNFQAQGVDAKLLIVPKGDRATAWYMAIPQIFDFFDGLSASGKNNNLSAAGYTIAFASFGQLNTDIFVADADGSNAKPLLANPALDYDASFSPDGKWIIFTSEQNGSADIYRAHLDGSG